MVATFGPFKSDPRHGDCPYELPSDANVLVKLVVIWSVIALGIWLITLSFFLYGGHRKQKLYELDRWTNIWQHRLEWCCFGAKSHLIDSKDILREVARELAHFFHDVDWAPSDIAVGLILIKREQKKINEIRQARRLIVEQPRGFEIPTVESSDTLVELQAVNNDALKRSSYMLFPVASVMAPSSLFGASVSVATITSTASTSRASATASASATATATTSTAASTSEVGGVSPSNDAKSIQCATQTSTDLQIGATEESAASLSLNEKSLKSSSTLNITVTPATLPHASASSSPSSSSENKSQTYTPTSEGDKSTANLLSPSSNLETATLEDSKLVTHSSENSPAAVSEGFVVVSGEERAFNDAQSEKSVTEVTRSHSPADTETSAASGAPLLNNAISSDHPDLPLSLSTSSERSILSKPPFSVTTSAAKSQLHKTILHRAITSPLQALSPNRDKENSNTNPDAISNAAAAHSSSADTNVSNNGTIFRPWSSRKKQRHHHRTTLHRPTYQKGTILREDIDDILHYAQFAEAVYIPDDVKAFSSNLIKHNPENGLFKSPYFIAHDEETDCFVIAIRGTFSAVDALVDLKFTLEEFEIPELKMQQVTHYTHSGMYATAKNIVEDIRRADLLAPLIKNPESPYFDCGLVVTGHSLGGVSVVEYF
jgi:hypothetical protein